MKNYLVALALLSLIAMAVAPAAATARIRAPAVILNNNTGSLTNITLSVTSGNGNVSIVGPQIVAQDTNQSAYTAAYYASNYTSKDFYDYNFTYNISDATNVSGPSAGAAMTMLAISALEGRPLRNDFTMTGTISPNGSIGQIGGVYDKVSAAKNAGMHLVIVPAVQSQSGEAELYYLVQTTFQIPLVQVSNISQATHFALNSTVSGIQNETTYSFYTDYNISKLPPTTLSCTQACNITLFNSLLNETFNLTRNEINALAQNPKFAQVAQQMGMTLNESIEIAKLNYSYTAADLAYLDYVNAFYFSGYPSTRSSALNQLNQINYFCSSLNQPQLTASDYDYVISAELRQYWGNYTISTAISAYNSSSIESDQILDELYLAAQANGWCTAASLIYGESASSQGPYLVPSQSLANLAEARINRDIPYGASLYLSTAQQAYKEGSYPVAILDADYAYAFGPGPTTYSVQQLDSDAQSMASNATYGIWATEFGKQALFYASESQLVSNATLAKTYAQDAYATATLAQQLSNDTMNIHNGLVVGTYTPPTTTIPGSQQISSSDYSSLINYVTYSQELIYALLVLVIALLIANTIMIMIVVNWLNRQQSSRQNSGRKERNIKRKAQKR